MRQFSMVYEVKQIRALSPTESDEFDAVVDVVWRIGLAQAEFRGNS